MFDRNSMKALALAGQLGFAVACPLLALGGGGFWLGQQWGMGPWIGFVGLIIGVLLAIGSIYQLAVAIPVSKPKPGAKPPPAYDDEDEDDWR